LFFNVTEAPFNDIRLRKAMVVGFDREAYTKVLRNNIIVRPIRSSGASRRSSTRL
jgi:ABC-type oligopeptide transport system substrate-binding subunit